MTLYFLVTRLPDSLRTFWDQFLTLDPREITLDSLEKSLLEAEKSTVAVAASCGTLRSPFFEGCNPSPLLPSVATAAAVDLLSAEEVSAASAPGGRHNNSRGKGGKGGGGGTSGRGGGGGGGGGGSGGGGGGGGRGGGGSGGGGGGGGGGGSGGGGGGRGGVGKGGGRGGSACGVGGPVQQLPRLPDNPTHQQLRDKVVHRVSPGGSSHCPYVRRTGKLKGQRCGKLHNEYRCFGRLEDAWVDEYGNEAIVPNWLKLQGMGVDLYALEFVQINKAIYAMYVTELSDEGACYSCVPGDAGVAASALGASESSVAGASESAASAKALHTFTLDSGASRCFFHDCTTLTPLAAPVPTARASTVLPCPAVPSGSLSGLHLPMFSTNLVSNAALQNVWVDTFTPGGQRVAICTCSRTGRHLATFTRRPGTSLYTVTTASAQVAESGQVTASSQVSASGQLAASCSCRVLSHQTLL
ncbi:unnamed protein product [Closterium sp. NIES-54]